jgi:hypothetical protein
MKRSMMVGTMLIQMLLVTAAWASPVPADDARSVRRFALLLASNYGGAERVTLKYAYDDATAFSEVLEELGGLSVQDRRVIMEPDEEGLKDAVAWLSGRLNAQANSGQRREVIFYYSGHSDENGLLPGGRRISYAEVRRLLSGLDCEVRIAVLDSCAAGAMTRMKGGSWTAPFLVDQSSDVRGQAILTSASANEAAQESDRIRASLFTHHMVSGLRGAADVDGDSRVTLNEAYRYAYKETLENSEDTLAGAQHPAYDFQLAGAGDLVLTDLTDNPGTLVLPVDLEGRIFIRGKGGRLIAEFGKMPGKALTLGLKPGEYSISVLHGGALKKTKVEVKQGGSDTLAVAALQPAPLEELRTRGTPAPEAPDEPGPVTYRKQSASLVFIPAMGDEPLTDNNFTVNLLGRAHDLEGLELSIVGGIRTGKVDGVQISGFYNQVQGSMRGVQCTDGVNIVESTSYGLQGGTVNWASKGFHGLQGSVANITKGEMEGLQGAVFNYAGNLEGLQGAVVNVAGRTEGVQAAVVNVVTDRGDGLQAGVVNVAGGEHHGLQIGVVNVAKKSDFSLGLVSVVRDGRSSFTVGGGDLALAAVEFKHGGDYWHTIYRVGGGGDGKESLNFGFGIGGHIPIGQAFYLDTDLISHCILDSETDLSDKHQALGEARLMAGYKLMPGLSLNLGVSMNVLVQEGGDKMDRYATFGGWNLNDGGATGNSVYMWPGFMAGLRLME